MGGQDFLSFIDSFIFGGVVFIGRRAVAMGRKKPKHKQRQKKVDQWVACVEKELALTAQQYGLEISEDPQDAGVTEVTLTGSGGTKKRKRQSGGKKEQGDCRGVEVSCGDLNRLAELFGGEFEAGRCCFPACR